MTRFLTGILAVIIAVSAVAFTRKPHNPKANLVFAYQKLTFGQIDVQSVDVSSWAIGAPSCGGDLVKACEIDVDQKYTHSNGSQTVLNDGSFLNHITISATPSSAGVYYVNTSSTNIANIVNKP